MKARQIRTNITYLQNKSMHFLIGSGPLIWIYHRRCVNHFLYLKRCLNQCLRHSYTRINNVFAMQCQYQYNWLREKCPYLELFWSAFFRIWTKYGEILCIPAYSVRMPKNADQNNSEYRHFLRSIVLFNFSFKRSFISYLMLHNP